MQEYIDTLHQHVHSYFDGHAAALRELGSGPIQEAIPGFHVIELAPGPRTQLWTYVSAGSGWDNRDGVPKIEFILNTPASIERGVELVTMTAYYHRTQQLGLGHTFPIGEPWVEGSAMKHMLVSQPYPYGEDLEILKSDSFHAHLYWLVPITGAERDFKVSKGLDALEELWTCPANVDRLLRSPIRAGERVVHT